MIVAVFDCPPTDHGHPPLPPLISVKAASDVVIFSHFVLRLLTTHSGIVSVSVENDILGITLVAAKVLLNKIH